MAESAQEYAKVRYFFMRNTCPAPGSETLTTAGETFNVIQAEQSGAYARKSNRREIL